MDVIGNDAGGRRWSIGELARQTGVTVRALHHYDRIGLLRASERTASGHRRYTEADLRRLYRVRALRALGIPLEEIKRVLAASADDLAGMRGLLSAQLGRLTVQADRIHRLTEQIHGLLGRLDAGAMPDPDQFMTTLEMISVLDDYYSQEQLDQLARRREALGPDAVEETKGNLAELIERLLVHVEADTQVDDPAVRDLVRRYGELSVPYQPEGITDEERERMREAARRLWQDHSEEIIRKMPWPAEKMRALYAYLDRAQAVEG